MRILGKMGQMYNMIVQLVFNVTWLLLEAWFELKIKYLLKIWSIKWDVLNRLKQINFFSSKNVNNLDVKIVNILEKIKKLDITIEKMLTIKLINSLYSFFKTYLTMLSQKDKNDNKLPNL